ncbi:hypothetical protein H2201_001935, partial [Coniosporium apollinis]
LFPPPLKKVKRSLSRKASVKQAAREPVAERLERAKSPVDFHELVIQVNSPTTASPVAIPPQACVLQTSLEQHGTAPAALDRRNAASPTPSMTHTRAESPPVSDARSAHRTRTSSPVSRQQAALPVTGSERQHAATPSISEVYSLRSGSPTLVRSNSAATTRGPRSPGEPPLMQSIFPRYDHGRRLSQQQYRPTQASPTHIPRDKISKAPYSPGFYSPHGDVLNGDASGSSSTTLEFTPAGELYPLWDAANGQGTPIAAQQYVLQMHRPVDATSSNHSQFVFGPSQSQPFYSLTQSSFLEAYSNGTESNDANKDHELLIQRHHPNKPMSFPIAHLTLRTPPPAPSPSAVQPPPLQQQSLITSIYPKLAALSALELAAQSPTASSLALVDPEATSPAAAQLAAEAVQEAAVRECCALTWTPAVPGGQARSATYELQHPSLGVFPIEVQGDVAQGLSSARSKSAASVFIRCPPSHNKNDDADRELRKPKGYGHNDDGDDVLARLGLSTDALTVDAGAIMRFGNAYLIDVAVSAVLAVAVAEANRRTETVKTSFEGPPTAAARGSPKLAAKELKKDKKAKHRQRQGDIEAGMAGEKDRGKEELPTVTRAVLKVLRVGFKTAVWVLELAMRVLTKMVVVATRCVQKA